MFILTLNQKIFLSLGGAIACVSLALLVNIWNAANQHITTQIHNDLNTAENTLRTIIHDSETKRLDPAMFMTAFEMNNSYIEDLKKIIHCDITFSSSEENNHVTYASTLDKTTEKRLNSPPQKAWVLFESKTNRLFSKKIEIAKQNKKTFYITLSKSSENIGKAFDTLQKKIVTTTILSLFIAAFAAWFIARSITKPISSLASASRAIASGDYDKDISVISHSSEISDLASVLKAMQKNIQRREEHIIFQSNHDMLTSLNNRMWVSNFILQQLDNKVNIQAFSINIVNFRAINDTFGYQNGDGYIQSLAIQLRLLPGNAARLNGGELLWFPDTKITKDDILSIRKKLEEPHNIRGVYISAKLVIAELQMPDHANNLEEVFRRLSITIEQAKKQAELFYTYNDELEKNYLTRLETIKELKKVLCGQCDEFTMYYQPKLHLSSKKIYKAEALIRWMSKERGFISPEHFIPIAEQAGLIGDITKWVIARVIQDICYWRENDIDIQVAINLSMQDITNDSLLPFIIEKLATEKLQHHCICFEITESEVMKHPEKSIKQLNTFRDNGFHLSVDDFGTGYSSLSYLKTIPVSELKIDKSFILKLDTQIDDQSIVQTIISLAKHFNLQIVAEGIENIDTMNLLEEWSCDWIQGYYISKPIPPEQLITWLREYHNTPSIDFKATSSKP